MLVRQNEILKNVEQKPFKRRYLTYFWKPLFENLVEQTGELFLEFDDSIRKKSAFNTKSHKRYLLFYILNNAINWLTKLILWDLGISYINDVRTYLLMHNIQLIIRQRRYNVRKNIPNLLYRIFQRLPYLPAMDVEKPPEESIELKSYIEFCKLQTLIKTFSNGLKFTKTRSSNRREYLYYLYWDEIRKFIPLQKQTTKFYFDTIAIEHKTKIYREGNFGIYRQNGIKNMIITKDYDLSCYWHINFITDVDKLKSICVCVVCEKCNAVIKEFGGPKREICEKCQLSPGVSKISLGKKLSCSNWQ